MLHLEKNAPGANITTASDALWYVIVTMSTVGYGDQYPVTNPGREMGSFIIVIGVGIFGTLTGYLANIFLTPHADTPAEVRPTQPMLERSSRSCSSSNAPRSRNSRTRSAKPERRSSR